MWKYILISCPFTYSLSLHFIFTCFINKQILYHFFFILYQFHFICFTSKMNIYQKITQIHSRPLPINSTNDSEQYWFLDNFVKIAVHHHFSSFSLILLLLIDGYTSYYVVQFTWQLKSWFPFSFILKYYEINMYIINNSKGIIELKNQYFITTLFFI